MGLGSLNTIGLSQAREAALAGAFIIMRPAAVRSLRFQ
jgi:hypothetical protein